MPRKLSNEELGRLSPEDARKAPKREVVVVLDNIRSLHNVGSAFRTADAFRIEALYLCGLTGTPPHREIEKTALGATATVAWKHFATTAEAINELKSRGYQLFAVEQTDRSIPLDAFGAAEKKTAFIFGNEVYGVEQEIVSLADGAIEIPQHGSKHSLNVAVAIGIVLWEILRGRVG